jgi:MFS family permease
MSQPEGAFQAISVPAFRRFALGRVCESMSGQVLAVAVGWQVYHLTGRPLDLGFVGLALFLPSVCLALFTGHTADRHDRRAVLALSCCLDAASVFALALLTVIGNRDPIWIFAVLVLVGTARAFQAPASFAILPNLVAPQQFANAAAWVSTAWQASAIAGPALGGVLYLLGPVAVYCTCAALSLFAAFLFWSLPSGSGPNLRGRMSWDNLLAGIRFIRSHPLVLGAISLDLFAVLLGGATALLPVFARDILHVGPAGLGVLRSAPAIGALCVGFYLLRFPLQQHAGRTLFITVAIFGVATVGFGLSETLWLSLLMLATLGAADMISVVIRRVLIQLATPDEMRGRVSAAESVFIGASNELGEFESGVTAALFGTVPAVILGGIGTLVVVGLWAWKFPELRQADRLDRPFQR